MSVKPIPEGYHTITPFLYVAGAPELIEFLKVAFGATELMRFLEPDGSVMHAQLKIGDSTLMMGEAMRGVAPTQASFYLYVSDADATYRVALAAGAVTVTEPADQFWGDRIAGIKDLAGNTWWIATHVEDVDPEELARRALSGKKPS